MAIVVGDAEIPVTADGTLFLRHLDLIAKRAEKRLDINARRMGKNFGRSLGKGLWNTIGSIDKLLTIMGAAVPAMAALGSAMSATASAATALVGAIGPPLVGAMGAAAGTALAAGQGFLFAKSAFKGFGDAIAGKEGALKGFNSDAREMVTTLKGLKPEMAKVRDQVQKGLFPGLNEAVSSLAKTYFPLLQTAGRQTGEVLGSLAQRGAEMLTSGPWRADFATITKANASNLGTLGGVIFNLLDVIRNLLVTSAPLTKRFLDWALGASESIKSMTEAGRATGALGEWFAKAGDMAAQWGDILGDLGVALYNVFAIGNETGPAQTMLSKMQELTQEFRDWTESAGGIEKISQWFKDGRTNLEALAGLVGDIGSGLNAISTAMDMGPIITQLREVVVPPLMEFLSNASHSHAIESMVDAVGKLLDVLSDMAQNGAFKAMFDMLGNIAEVVKWIFDNVPGAKAGMTTLLTLMGAFAGLKMVGLGPAIMAIGGAITALVGKLAVHLGIMAADTTAINVNAASYRFLHGPMMTAVAGRAKEIAVLTAQKVATAASTAMIWLQTTAWKALNLVMRMNPIGLIITAIMALIGVFVLLYKKNETFRKFVDAAWKKIKEVIAGVVDWIMNTAWPVIKKVWEGISQGAQTLWGWIKTAWGGIQSAIGAVWAVLQPIFEAIRSFIMDKVVPAFQWIGSVVKTVFQMISVLVYAGWVGLQIVFDKIKQALGWVGDKFTWLWVNVIKPVWDNIKVGLAAAWGWIKVNVFDKITAGVNWLKVRFEAFKVALGIVWDWIKAKISAAWNWIRDNVFAFITRRLDVLKANFNLLKTAIGVAWDWIKTKLKAGWDWIKVNVFDRFKSGLDTLKSKFETVKDGIGTAWKKVEGLAKAPIKFVIQTVLNKGLIGGFNWLSSKIGGPHVDPIPLPPGFAGGGVLPGYSPGRDIHEFFSPTGGRLRLSGGEAIMRPEFTKAMGGKRGIALLNRLVRRGKLPDDLMFANGGVWGGAPTHSYAGGGLIDWIKSKTASAWNWVSEKAGAIWDAVTHPWTYVKNLVKNLINKIPGAKTMVDFGVGAVNKSVDAAIAKVKALWDSFQKAFASSGMGSAGPATLAAMRTNGTGYKAMTAWLKANVPGTWVSSDYRPGAITALGNISRHGLGRAIDIVPPGMTAFNKIVSGIGLRNINQLFYSRAPRSVNKGAWWNLDPVTRSGHYNHIHWGMAKGGVFDQGGILRPGINVVQNTTGRNEHLVPANANGPTHITVHMTVSVDDLAKMTKVGDFLDMLDKARLNARMTERSGRVAV